ncbi:hypothetical protein Hanom_Chr02g00178071 [Helianthus anomalus]
MIISFLQHIIRIKVDGRTPPPSPITFFIDWDKFCFGLGFLSCEFLSRWMDRITTFCTSGDPDLSPF